MTAATVTPIAERGYAHADVLVSTDWVAERLDDPRVRIVESDEDLLLYETGHIRGAVKLDWVGDLNDPVVRDYVGRAELERVLRSKGINDDTTIVFYGDKNNWWATYAFWVLRLFGAEQMKVMDGGRARWADEGRELVTEVPRYAEGNISLGERNDGRIRAFREDVLNQIRLKKPLVDVRSPEEYRGERLHMPEYPNEGALRGGHIPGARNVPWGRAIDPETHTFLPAAALKANYVEEQGLEADQEVIAYCRIGERSSHTWFVLTYLLGFENVRNYDGSWTEWGNSVRAPIERA
ncbi:MAG: sulfurtransferase [Gemmatimonadales bacterium]|jgi:thiosulfate/3-mercaptopyruvate sulfurtransferase